VVVAFSFRRNHQFHSPPSPLAWWFLPPQRGGCTRAYRVATLEAGAAGPRAPRPTYLQAALRHPGAQDSDPAWALPEPTLTAARLVDGARGREEVEGVLASTVTALHDMLFAFDDGSASASSVRQPDTADPHTASLVCGVWAECGPWLTFALAQEWATWDARLTAQALRVLELGWRYGTSGEEVGEVGALDAALAAVFACLGRRHPSAPSSGRGDVSLTPWPCHDVAAWCMKALRTVVLVVPGGPLASRAHEVVGMTPMVLQTYPRDVEVRFRE